MRSVPAGRQAPQGRPETTPTSATSRGRSIGGPGKDHGSSVGGHATQAFRQQFPHHRVRVVGLWRSGSLPQGAAVAPESLRDELLALILIKATKPAMCAVRQRLPAAAWKSPGLVERAHPNGTSKVHRLVLHEAADRRLHIACVRQDARSLQRHSAQTTPEHCHEWCRGCGCADMQRHAVRGGGNTQPHENMVDASWGPGLCVFSHRPMLEGTSPPAVRACLHKYNSRPTRDATSSRSQEPLHPADSVHIAPLLQTDAHPPTPLLELEAF